MYAETGVWLSVYISLRLSVLLPVCVCVCVWICMRVPVCVFVCVCGSLLVKQWTVIGYFQLFFALVLLHRVYFSAGWPGNFVLFQYDRFLCLSADKLQMSVLSRNYTNYTV